jgi:Zn-dependent protease
MMGGGRRWRIATVRGIPIHVSTSWFFIVLLVVLNQYASLSRFVGVEDLEALWLAVLVAVLFFGSILVHEGAHAVMARGLDLPVIGITLVFWGGATETKASARGAGGEFLIAFVGPASTLVLAGVFWLVAQAASGAAAFVLEWLAWISLLLAGVNALPAFPLDGGRMFLAAVWAITRNRRTGMRAAGWVGLAIGVGMAFAALAAFRRNDLGYIFLGYLAFVLIATGRSMERRIAFRDQLVRGTVADAMRPPPTAVPADISLLAALDHYLRGTDGVSFPVMADGRVVGTVSIESARRVGARDPLRPVSDGMAPLSQTPTVAPDETLDDALEWLAGREAFVLRDGALVGVIDAADVERWYRRVIEGKPEEGATVSSSIPPRPDR